ncbi:hypothetical protein J21TS7_52230 [Paenibacillus cineris]|uniref:Polymerase nucleotidyl transferase domain-containing protein n=2 Tax=Paenibacillus cineris TaxID=237530 RepID=A0ABQ4LKI7_9BACL|nr:hypothetical protein J21TS7_52230 [Paenibacillus cineris]
MESFVVLIGSVARKDYSVGSDIDICRINSDVTINRQTDWPDGPINYIDYDTETFQHLYNIGSLFIYHILTEGILIEGNIDSWEKLILNFSLTGNFSNEIVKILDLNEIFKKTEIFGNHYLSLFSNLFTNVKNFSIFYLARNGIYLFNKEKAIKYTFGEYYYDLIFDAYNYFERGVINKKWNYSCKKIAIEVTNYYLSKMEALYKC